MEFNIRRRSLSNSQAFGEYVRQVDACPGVPKALRKKQCVNRNDQLRPPSIAPAPMLSPVCHTAMNSRIRPDQYRYARNMTRHALPTANGVSILFAANITTNNAPKTIETRNNPTGLGTRPNVWLSQYAFCARSTNSVSIVNTAAALQENMGMKTRLPTKFIAKHSSEVSTKTCSRPTAKSPIF